MRVFYQCFGRAHSSIAAAHLHLGHLSARGVPSLGEIMALPYFDRSGVEDFGVPLAFGKDAAGHEIFALGLGMAAPAGLGAIASMFRLAGEEGPLIVDTLSGLGLLARVGGALSRQLGLVALGRPLVAHGLRRAYPRLVETVAGVKRFLEEVTG
ncbi:MAG: DUF3189 family protein [Patescibacteria group bacterium]